MIERTMSRLTPFEVDRRSGHGRRRVNLFRETGHPDFDLRTGLDRRSGRDRRLTQRRRSVPTVLSVVPDIVTPWQLSDRVQ
jgi:hypothetical protein